MKRVSVFAPATVANVAVGFDILGFPVEGVGDVVTLTRIDKPIVELDPVGEVPPGIPNDPLKNTATVGLIQWIKDQRLRYGFRVNLKKQIPLSSGMGGSAASAVGAIVAAGAFLDTPVPLENLLPYALMGEAVASGAAHADNISPCLFGGLTLTLSVDPPKIVRIPVPDSILCVLVHPHFQLSTRAAREVLEKDISLKDHVHQSALMAGFIAGCCQRDLSLIRHSLRDLIIEPQRAPLVPAFSAVQKAAMATGALGCSLSGSGPSVFAWTDSSEHAVKMEAAMVSAFGEGGLKADSWVSKVAVIGARIMAQE